MIRLIFCLSLFLCFTNAAVHKFMAHPYLVEDKTAISHRNTIRSRRLIENHENLPEFLSSYELEPSLGLSRSNDSYYIYIANVTIGTPAQTFVMEIDLWEGTDLCVLGPNANLSKVSSKVPSKHVFYPSDSSSYVDKKGNFSDYVCGKGRNASDKVKVDQISANVVMGVIDRISYYFKYYPIDGILGLTPSAPDTNANNLVSQLIGGLDTPIMTWWQNQSHGSGPAQLTLGGEDTDNCKSNYVYGPQVWSYGGSYGDFRVHLTSASVDGKSDSEVGLNTTLTLWPEQGHIYCSYDFFYILTNASNAVYNSTLGVWQADCDTTKAKNVILNIGGSGNVTDGSTKKLILTGADYIIYSPYYDICFIYASPYDTYPIVELSYLFMNNHCLAYNAKAQTVGFADAKWVKTNART